MTVKTITAETVTAETVTAKAGTVGATSMEQSASPGDVETKQWRQAAETTAASVRKVALAYVGAAAYAADGVLAVYRGGERLVTSAEQRGAAMKQGAWQRFGNLEEQAVHEMRKLQGQAEENFQQMRESRGDVNEEIEKRIELVLANMGLPSRERLERLGQEIDALNQKLDEQFLRLPVEPIPDPLG